MMKRFFDVEGPVFGLLDKTGQLILLSFFWLIGCLPVVTIGTANAALYYAVCKSVRFGQGSAIKSFFTSYLQNLLRGTGVTLVMLGVGIVLVSGFLMLSSAPGGVFAVGLVLLACIFSYVGAVMSRFSFGVSKVLKLSLVMALQYAHYTLLFLAGTAVLAVGVLYVLPMACLLILPGVWCLITTYPMEKALRRYMPPKTDDDNNWYYGNEKGAK